MAGDSGLVHKSEGNMTLERAKKALQRMGATLDLNMKCFGIPVDQFDRDDLTIMLAMSMQETERERELHHGTLGIMKACSQRRARIPA
jgi:hypothetical protein